MLSHICSHMEDQNQLGLQATQKALKTNPGNTALLFNLRVFQNRIGTKRDIQHVILSSPSCSTLLSNKHPTKRLRTIHLSVLGDGLQMGAQLASLVQVVHQAVQVGNAHHGEAIVLLDLLHRTQELERQKGILYGVALITLGIACSAMSGTGGGTDVRDFISGVLLGLSVAEILAGIYIIGKQMAGK